MSLSDPNDRRRRRAGTIAAICGGAAASSAALGHHAASHGPENLVWQDIGIAAAVVLIVFALVACAVLARRCR